MSARHAWTAAGGLVLLTASALLVVRMRSTVDDKDLREARAEVERVRSSLDEVECERPPLLGPASHLALPLEEFLSSNGPFGECWAAAASPELEAYFERPGPTAGFRAERLGNLQALVEPREPRARGEAFDRVVASCERLPQELERQARTPNRCSPVRPSSERWQRQQEEGDPSVGTILHMAYAVYILVESDRLSTDERLRIVVQGMAVARDVGHGPSGFLMAMLGAASEQRLASKLVRLLEVSPPTHQTRQALDDALEVLASMPIDTHVVLSAEGVALYDATVIYGVGDEDERLFGEYGSATLLSRIQETCPPGIEVDACMEQLPFVADPSTPWKGMVFGPRYQAEEALSVLHSIGSESYERYLRRMEGVRANAHTLQQILQWSAARIEGRCPERSPWDPEDHHDRMFVDDNGRGTFQFVAAGTYGFERCAFYYRCTPTGEESPTSPSTEGAY